MQRNEDLFFVVADRVQFDPKSYNQERWATVSSESMCGSVACIAGHGLMLTGWGVSLVAYGTFYKDGRVLQFGSDIQSVAAIAFNLSTTESRVLFHGRWKPREGLTVSDALRLIGKGEKVSVVTQPPTPVAPVDPTDDWDNAEARLDYDRYQKLLAEESREQ